MILGVQGSLSQRNVNILGGESQPAMRSVTFLSLRCEVEPEITREGNVAATCSSVQKSIRVIDV